MQSDATVLSRIGWEFFGSLTFKHERLPERVRLSMWFAASRTLASWHRLHFKTLVWVLRMERGDLFGRIHFHFLITGLPAGTVHDQTSLALMGQWERMGGGIARVRVYDPSLAGADYITACLDGLALQGANAYESGKFGYANCEVMLSESVTHYLDSRRASEGYRRSIARTLGGGVSAEEARPMDDETSLSLQLAPCGSNDGSNT